MAVQNWSLSMDNRVCAQAVECIERIRFSIPSPEFGYKIQALAAHVLLRLGYTVTAVNQQGHPDIAAVRSGNEFHFEVEAQAGNPRLRQLYESDFASLIGVGNVAGYYALSISFPRPYWVIVPASKLVGRPPSPNILMEALSDSEYSAEWTRQYIGMLREKCRLIRLATFRDLSRMAVTRHGL